MQVEKILVLTDEEIEQAIREGIFQTWNLDELEIKRMKSGLGCSLVLSMDTYPYIENAKASVFVKEQGVTTQTTCADAMSYPMFNNMQKRFENLLGESWEKTDKESVK